MAKTTLKSLEFFYITLVIYLKYILDFGLKKGIHRTNTSNTCVIRRTLVISNSKCSENTRVCTEKKGL